MSAFNVDQFLQTEIKGANDTKLIPIPPGEYKAQITKVNARRIAKDGQEPRVVVDILWEVLDDNVKKVTGLDKPIAKQGIFLDVTPNGGLDMGKGKNVQLGKLRDALGQNRDGRPWNFKMLAGAIATIKIDNRADESDPTILYNDVKSVGKL